MGEPLAKFWLFASVSGTDTTSTEENKLKKYQWGNPFQNVGCYLYLDAFVGLPREAKSGFKKKIARWGNPSQNFGCLLQ